MQQRTRLARELHDSPGHTVNVMVLQAGVGRRVLTDNPGFAHEALVSIETVGRGALQELDRLLEVLQPDEGNRHAVPFAPTLRTWRSSPRGSGRPVELRMDGVVLPDSCARALYRIVQEALTNAVRHTSSGRIRIEVSRDGAHCWERGREPTRRPRGRPSCCPPPLRRTLLVGALPGGRPALPAPQPRGGTP